MTGRAANARRLYLHALEGGTVTARDMARLVETIEQLEATEEWFRIIGLRACEIGESWAISADDRETLEVIRAELTKQANEGSNDNMAHHRVQPGQGKRL